MTQIVEEADKDEPLRQLIRFGGLDTGEGIKSISYLEVIRALLKDPICDNTELVGRLQKLLFNLSARGEGEEFEKHEKMNWAFELEVLLQECLLQMKLIDLDSNFGRNSLQTHSMDSLFEGKNGSSRFV